jgi:hypothetical protein
LLLLTLLRQEVLATPIKVGQLDSPGGMQKDPRGT